MLLMLLTELTGASASPSVGSTSSACAARRTQQRQDQAIWMETDGRPPSVRRVEFSGKRGDALLAASLTYSPREERQRYYAPHRGLPVKLQYRRRLVK